VAGVIQQELEEQEAAETGVFLEQLTLAAAAAV
jgi:hypothetical protein